MAGSYRRHCLPATFFALACVLSHAVCDSPQIHNLLTFRPPRDSSSDFQQIEPDWTTGDIYVAGRNTLYHLSADLETRMIISTGPKLDNPLCPIPPAPCEHERVPMDNDMKILEIFRTNTTTYIMACGTLYHGVCMTHDPSDIIRKAYIYPINETLGYISGKGSTIAFFGALDGMFMFITATSYDERAPDYIPLSVASRGLKFHNKSFHFTYTHQSETGFSGINFKERKNYPIEYVFGFQHEDYVYLLATQRVSMESEAIETRLARICKKDPNFFSYTEIPLKCNYGLESYNLATSAYVSIASPVLVRRLKLGVEPHMVLYVSFVKTIPDHGRTVDESKGSVICSFPILVISEAFVNATRDCFRAEPRASLLRHVTGVDLPCTKRDEDVNFNEFCGSAFNHYIQGRAAIPGGFRMILSSHVTSIVIRLTKGQTIAAVGTKTGDIIKVDLDKRENQVLFSTNVAEDQPNKEILRSCTFDKKMEFVYFLTRKKVVKFPIYSCSIYTDCASCLTTSDPLQCGWCGSYCAHLDECQTPDVFTKNSCTPVIYSIHPKQGPMQGGTLLTIRGDNFGMGHLAGEHQSKINITVVGFPCELYSWQKTMVQCNTSSIIGYKSLVIPEREQGFVAVTVYDDSWEAGEFDMKGKVQSKELFVYAKAELNYFLPGHGPVSGGTNITLFGKYMDIGYYKSIKVAGVFCKEMGFSSNMSWCVTGPLSSNTEAENKVVPYSGPVQLLIDNAILESNQTDKDFIRNFKYLHDPEIYSIHPHATTISGTKNVTITGKYLDSVSNPRMIVNVASSLTGESLQITSEVCMINGSTLMLCPTPKMDLSDLHAPTDRAPLVTHVGFLMNGVQKLRQLPLYEREMSQLLYYPDPEFYPFHGVHDFSADTKELHLKGRYLGLAHDESDMEITVDGSTICNIVSLQTETVTCRIESNEILDQGLDATHSVKVTVGSLTFFLGSFKFIQESSYSVYMWMLGAVILGAVGFVAFACWKYKNRRKKPSQPSFVVNWNGGNDDTCAGGRRQGNCNDYQGLPTQQTVPKAGAAGASPGTLVSPEVDDETMSLLQSENILYDRQYLDLGEIIGQGHFGCVYKGILKLQDREETLEVAVKTLRIKILLNKEQNQNAFIKEGLMMKDFHHPNVLNLVGICFDENGSPMVITPFMKHGDLYSYIASELNNPTVLALVTFGKQIASGMKYLAKIKFVHRDLAARNCMLDDSLVVKIADFGLSRDIYERDYYTCDSNGRMPIKWMAPESLEKGNYTSKSDVWSYGVVLWELMTRGVVPYPYIDNYDMLPYLKSGRRMPQPSFCPDKLYDIMLRCWDADPAMRPTFDELEGELEAVLSKSKTQKEKVVGLDVTYVNCPEIVTNVR